MRSKTVVRLGFLLAASASALSAALFTACGSSDEGVAATFTGGPRDEGGSGEVEPGPDGGGACAPVAFTPRDGELYLVVDTSGSMTGGKLPAERDGILRFVSDPASLPLFVGMIRHPEGTAGSWCESAPYTDAAVPVRRLADLDGAAAESFDAALARPAFGASPWSGALGAAANEIAREAALHPERNVAMVFLADETPTACDRDAGALAALVAAPAAASPPARTFVVGMLSAPSDAGAAGFESLATAGRTAPATVLVAPDITGASVAEALGRARDEVACELEAPSDLWPAVADGTRPPTVIAAGGAYVARRVDDASRCPSATPEAGASPSDAGLSPEGVAYFAPRPGVIALCPEACRALLRDRGGRLEARCP